MPHSRTRAARAQLNRREFAAGALAATVLRPLEAPAVFRLWAIGDAHVGTDLKRGRESLADAIRQSEHGGKDGAPPFDWDIALNVGDFSGNQSCPDDAEGREVVRQYSVATKHRREDFYDLVGNHDASGPREKTQWWFRKWLDPEGKSTAFSGVDARRRRYPIDGTWERYSFRVGNLLFLVMGDRNDGGPPVGRGERGGYPAGAVTAETFDWWRRNVEANPDAIIVSAHHHMLRETTVGSGDFEGGTLNPDGTWKARYHGHMKDAGSPEGASYLYYVGGVPKALAFEKYLEAHPGAIALWIGGHTHTTPDDNFGGRSHIERKWGVTFINCCALTRYHVSSRAVPMSRLLTFTDGSAKARVQCYLHDNTHAPQGWYDKAEREIDLGKAFRWEV